MAIFKRNKTYWTDFSVNGQRYRMSLHTGDWREAQSEEKKKIAEAQDGKLSPASQQFAHLAFSEAADRYLLSRRLELSPRSLKKETQLLVQPRKFFGATRVSKISTDDLLAFRETQRGNPSYVNMQMGVIRRILKRAKRWHIVGGDLRPLKERPGIGRALSPDEKRHLLKTASLRPEWQTARLAANLALNTTMRGGELKSLLWRDVDLIERTVTVRKSKTEAGERVIPLNSDAFAVVIELFHRAEAFAGTETSHYVFPSCENGKIDPKKPQKSWRTAWRKLTRTIECPRCGKIQNPGKTCANSECAADIHEVVSPTAGLRFHDLRHHAITELAESRASDQTIMAIAGHVSQKMLSHYSHVRLDPKRKALDALSSNRETGSTEGGYGTRNVTNRELKGIPPSEVIEKMVGTRRLELLTSTVSR